ncbi:hypothetical protein DFH08DRAFT_890273 [Mycena albidolilacea]|uniref:Uncharacterized protein n=1 Tax=Mycena albidolilacea TaxID=1033008 RepID=A0AAD6ZF94_9AGAR|nr:hypothetical protein DFH08DRAFT_890273 [Mycena albidolilacea]
MDNTTELELSTITVLRTNNDPSPGCTIDVSSTNVSSGSNFENNLPRPSLHLGAHSTPSTAQIIGLTRHSGAVISREDLEEELRRRDNQINEFKDLFISRMEDHEKEQTRKDNQLGELMNRIAALEGNLLHMHNTTELTPSDTIVSSEVLGNNNDPARTIDVSEDNLPRPSLHLGGPNTLSTAQIIGLTRGFVMNHIAALEVKLTDRNPPNVKITPWRILNTVLVLGLGVYKSVGTYLGQTTGPTTVDWIGSLVWAMIVYWVSLYEPLVDDDPDSEELLVWIFCQDLSSILPTFPGLLFFAAIVLPGALKILVLRHLAVEPQSGSFLYGFIYLIISLMYSTFSGSQFSYWWLYLLPKLGSLWRWHIPPFFRILPFDSSDWMIDWTIVNQRWYRALLELFLPAFLTSSQVLGFWGVNSPVSFFHEGPSQRELYIFTVCSGFVYIATGLLKMLHRLLTRGRNRGLQPYPHHRHCGTDLAFPGRGRLP